MWGHAIGEGQDALFAWNDDVLDGAGFIDWYTFDHPTLGQVELGGWDRWSTASPPHSMIAAEVARNVRWLLTFAEKTPQVAIQESSAVHRADGDIRINASVANVGWMATATVQASEILGTAVPVLVNLELGNAQPVGRAAIEIGVLPGTHGDAASSRELSWTVHAVDPNLPVEVTIMMSSEKAGTVRRSLVVPAAGAIHYHIILPASPLNVLSWKSVWALGG
jgi:hypothetical protein